LTGASLLPAIRQRRLEQIPAELFQIRAVTAGSRPALCAAEDRLGNGSAQGR
jgi:hypothetical protein